MTDTAAKPGAGDGGASDKSGRAADYSVEFAAGEVVFREGDLGTNMYLVQSGKVEIFTGSGDRVRSLATLEKGDFFGEMAVLEGLPRSASARALTDARLLRIDGSTFTQMIQSNPDIAVRMMKKLSSRLRETDEMLRDAMTGPVVQPAGASERGALVEDPTVLARWEEGAREPHRGQKERLVHPGSGMDFALSSGSETTLGRRDPVTGIEPDIDLTPVDVDRSTSRRHAKIYRRGDKFFIAEESATLNGTFRNGERLKVGTPVEIAPGDEIRCGVVDLRFLVD